jgi:hypothetical protein
MWFFLEEDKKPKAFISCSLRKEDQKYITMVTSIVKLMGFVPTATVGKYSASPSLSGSRWVKGLNRLIA